MICVPYVEMAVNLLFAMDALGLFMQVFSLLPFHTNFLYLFLIIVLFNYLFVFIHLILFCDELPSVKRPLFDGNL